MSCSGYRSTQQLRIRDESDSVVKKALKYASSSVPQSLPLSVNLQMHGQLFAYHVPNTSKYWVFLKHYYRPTSTPDPLTLAIEAVSLAYFWHQVYSDSVLATARERYVSALRMITKCLRSFKEATKDTTLLAAILLDVFEKITAGERHNGTSWICHVEGGLTLIRLRGLEDFQNPASIRVLLRVSTNHVISCITNCVPIIEDVNAILSFVETRLDSQDPNWQMSKIMVDYANLRSGIRMGTLSGDTLLRACVALDAKLQALDLGMPPSWQYSTTRVDHKTDYVYGSHFDSYPGRNVTQGRNGLRIIRILINQSLLGQYSISPPSDQSMELKRLALENVKTLVSQICASVPQYVDCNGAACQTSSTSERIVSSNQTPSNTLARRLGGRCGEDHTPTRQLDCYTLIFPLYVAGISNALPPIRDWVISQIHHISSHFHIRIAETIAQILEHGPDRDPWDVYTMLGSYAFAA